MAGVAELVHRGDLDELVRAVDVAASRRDFDEVLALRRACLDAVEFSGRQLWGPAAYAAYRLVLEAPVGLAVDTLLVAQDRHTLGPLTEVVAQHHAWTDLAGLLPPGPLSGTVAVERVLRGDDLGDDPRAETHHLDVPQRRVPWEGPAPVVEYRARDVLSPAPVPVPVGPAVDPGSPGPPIDDSELVQAWEVLVAPWATSPDGRVAVAVADGPAPAAVAHLAPGVPLHPVALPDVVALVTWAASSGGALQRRRGGAAGRSATWWALRVLVDHEPSSPPDELHDDLSAWSWHVFDGPSPAPRTDGDESAAQGGWSLRIAGSHPDGWSLAIDAHDPPPEDLVLPVAEDDDPAATVPAPDDQDDLDPWAALDRAIRDVAERDDDPASGPRERREDP